jgi:tungstate transport system ATP-binding protein
MNKLHTLHVDSLDMRFRRRQVLCNITLDLQAGQAVLLCGPNGAGKTTLLKILAGLERPDTCWLDLGCGMLSWKQSRGSLLQSTLYLHQHPYMFDGSVRYNLAYALPRNLHRRQRDELIDQAVAWAGLEHLMETPSKSLSGGERQRVSLARAWLRQPRILLLDEPTANLDQLSRQRTLELLSPFKQAGMSLIIASHDAHHFAELADRSLHLHEGALIEAEPMQVRAIDPAPNSPSLRTRA